MNLMHNGQLDALSVQFNVLHNSDRDWRPEANYFGADDTQLCERVAVLRDAIQKVDCTVNVICRGRKHSIRVHDGKLVLLDHDNLHRENSVIEMGGQACRCLTIRNHWA